MKTEESIEIFHKYIDFILEHPMNLGSQKRDVIKCPINEFMKKVECKHNYEDLVYYFNAYIDIIKNPLL